jgi:tRNA threonylcarbamoyladenosine biosynthesis protein TsaE
MPILDHHSFEIISRSPEQTRRVGMRLGSLLQTGDLVGLVGDLGSGKTTLVQGVAAGWGSLDMASSPTFVLVNVYRRPDKHCLFHLDAYRLGSVEEAIDLDLDAMLAQGPMVVEWADRIQGAFPGGECLWVRLNLVDEFQRDMIFSAHDLYYQVMLTKFRKLVYGG